MADYVGKFIRARRRARNAGPVSSVSNAESLDLEGPQFVDWANRDRTHVREYHSFDETRSHEYPELFWYSTPEYVNAMGAGRFAGGTGSAAGQAASFIYLDVGAWVGGGPPDAGERHRSGISQHSPAAQLSGVPTMSEEDESVDRRNRWKDRGKGPKREFGIICGPHALLCSFTSSRVHQTYRQDVRWKDSGWRWGDQAPPREDKWLQSIVRLIERLSTPTSSTSELGEVCVLRYMVADSRNRPWEEADPYVYVFVGDMHIPVVDSRIQAAPPIPPPAAPVPPRTSVDRGLDRAVQGVTSIGQTLEDAAHGVAQLGRRGTAAVAGLAPGPAGRLAHTLAMPSEYAVRQPRVMRLGRADLGPFQVIIDELTSGGGDTAGAVLRLIDALNQVMRERDGAFADERRLDALGRDNANRARQGEAGAPPSLREEMISEAEADMHELAAQLPTTWINSLGRLCQILFPGRTPARLTLDVLRGANNAPGTAMDGLNTILRALAACDRAGRDLETMTVHDAVNWFRGDRVAQLRPRAGSGSEITSEPGADIFEHAGADFLEFAKRLRSYANAQMENTALFPFNFQQLGDMLDFWIGFTANFDPAPLADTGPEGRYQPVRVHNRAGHHGREAIQHWTNNCLSDTIQGRYIAEALDIIQSCSPSRSAAIQQIGRPQQVRPNPAHDERPVGPLRDPIYLAGNHDNYLSDRSLQITYLRTYNVSGHSGDDASQDLLGESAHGHLRPTLAPRAARFDDAGIWSEHGHQWDSSNKNSAPASIPAFLLGTASPMGMAVTQAAYLRPSLVRGAEDAAVGLLCGFPGEYGQRLTQIACAATIWTRKSGSFAFYVMGHTHVGGMCKVFITADVAVRSTTITTALAPGAVVLTLTREGNVPRHIAAGAAQPEPARLRLGWSRTEDSIRSGDVVTVAGAVSPVEGSPLVVRGLAMPAGETHGSDVRPAGAGVYVLRYYSGALEGQPHATSGPVTINGISIEDEIAITGHGIWDDERVRPRPSEFTLTFDAQGELIAQPNTFPTLYWAAPIGAPFDPEYHWMGIIATSLPDGVNSRGADYLIQQHLLAGRSGTPFSSVSGQACGLYGTTIQLSRADAAAGRTRLTESHGRTMIEYLKSRYYYSTTMHPQGHIMSNGRPAYDPARGSRWTLLLHAGNSLFACPIVVRGPGARQ